MNARIVGWMVSWYGLVSWWKIDIEIIIPYLIVLLTSVMNNFNDEKLKIKKNIQCYHIKNKFE